MSKYDAPQVSTLEVFNIGKRYKNRPVLRNVSLNVKRGEAVGLLGPNGAGKTTCFYCVTGLITPDYGDVHIDGQDITNLPMYRRARMGIGYLPQEFGLYPNLTVRESLEYVGIMSGVQFMKSLQSKMFILWTERSATLPERW